MIRSGIGFDVHRLVEGRQLVLGGVTIEHPRGLAGHSDGDALLHAIADGLLGAAAQGDIGQLFPPDDPQYDGADSIELLRVVVGRIDTAGYRIVNVDATVIAEAPRMQPHIAAMRDRIAAALGVDGDRVSVKATTFEGLGVLGREEGIAALAVATLESG